MPIFSDALENIDQWINALESDIYQQTRGQLRDGDAMCCFGVLCDISGVSVWTNEVYMGEEGILPDEVVKWIGLSTSKGNFYLDSTWILSLPEHIRNKLELTVNSNNNSYTCLITLNDNDWTFKEIAELIRFNPPGLFDTGVALQGVK